MSACNLGGGANPLLGSEERRRLALDYTIADISASELAKAPDDVAKVQLDITRATLPSSFAIVVSRQLLEHVRHPENLHRNVHALLVPGGLAVHFSQLSTPFPTW